MALSLSRILLSTQQSVLQQVSVCAGAQSIRWRVRRRKLWQEQDEKDTSWMEPLLEYNRERAARQGAENEPAMMHVVRRVQPLKGRPWWEKKVMEKLGLDGTRNSPVIHKNCPKTNRLLKDVKHLVSVQALRFPHGFPDDPADFPHVRLTTAGDLLVTKTLHPLPAHHQHAHDQPEPEVEQPANRKWSLQIDTLRKELQRKLDNYEVHEEYVKPHYTYTRNQDGKEFRYTARFNKPQGK